MLDGRVPVKVPGDWRWRAEVKYTSLTAAGTVSLSYPQFLLQPAVVEAIVDSARLKIAEDTFVAG